MSKSAGQEFGIEGALRAIDKLGAGVPEDQIQEVIYQQIQENKSDKTKFCISLLSYYLALDPSKSALNPKYPINAIAAIVGCFESVEEKQQVLSESLADAISESDPLRFNHIFSEVLNYLFMNPLGYGKASDDEITVVCAKGLLSFLKGVDVKDHELTGKLIESVLRINHISFEESTLEAQIDILATTLCGAFGIPDFPEDKANMFLRQICKTEYKDAVVEKAKSDLTEHEREDLVQKLNNATLIAKLDNLELHTSVNNPTAQKTSSQSSKTI